MNQVENDPSGTPEFTRDNRYVVLKRSDLWDLTQEQRGQLGAITRAHDARHLREGKPDLQCVVVEADWPEFEPTWSAIQKRVEPLAPVAPMSFEARCEHADRYLLEGDRYLLGRFIETTEDDEGYDLSKDEMKRLAELGVVQNNGFGRYSVTAFGYYVHETVWLQNPKLPLLTNADRDVAHRQSLAATKEQPNENRS